MLDRVVYARVWRPFDSSQPQLVKTERTRRNQTLRRGTPGRKDHNFRCRKQQILWSSTLSGPSRFLQPSFPKCCIDATASNAINQTPIDLLRRYHLLSFANNVHLMHVQVQDRPTQGNRALKTGAV